MVASFDVNSPRTSAQSVHVWVVDTLGLSEDDLLCLQIDDAKRKVYLKFVADHKLHAVLRTTGGKIDFHHESGEVSTVTLEMAVWDYEKCGSRICRWKRRIRQCGSSWSNAVKFGV
jgi:hypothetical protein